MAERSPDDGRRQKAVSFLEDDRRFLALMIAVSAVVLAFTALTDKWSDLDHYYDNVGDLLDGRMPYSGFQFEYPPLSLAFMLVPRLLSWDMASYHIACVVWAYVFIIIGALVLDRFADEEVGTRWQVRAMLLMAVVFCSYFMITRNDIFAAVLTLVAVRLFQKDRPVLAAAILAAAAMVKIYPAVLLLPMMGMLAVGRDWRGIALSIAAAAAVCLLAELPFLIDSPSTAFDYLTYHSDRGVQVESVAGGFFLLWDMILPCEMHVEFGYGSHNVVGIASDALAPWMNPVLAAAVLATVLWIVLRVARSGMDGRGRAAVMGIACALMLMVFTAFSKVYSAQYLIWIMMLLPLTQASSIGQETRSRLFRATVPFGFFSMCSYLSYACLDIYGPNPVITVMICAKNVCHIVLMAELFRAMAAETRPRSGVSPDPDAAEASVRSASLDCRLLRFRIRIC